MKTPVKFFLILCLVLDTFNLAAQIKPITYVKKNYGLLMSSYNQPLDTVTDDHYTELINPLSGWAVLYKHGKVNNYVRLAVHDTAVASTAFSYNFLIKVTAYSITGVSSTFNVTIPLSYDPAQYKAYRDVSVYKFSGAHKFTCNILSVTDAVTSASVNFSTLKKKFSLQQIIEVERYFKGDYNAVVDSSELSGTASAPGKYTIDWSGADIKAPTVFELEWLHVDNYGAGYADFLKDYTVHYQPFNNAGGWYNAVANTWGVSNGNLFFHNNSAMNHTGLFNIIPGHTYRLTAKIAGITNSGQFALKVFTPCQTGMTYGLCEETETSAVNATEADLVFEATNDTIYMAMVGNNGSVYNISELTLLDITFEPEVDGEYIKPAEKLRYNFKNDATRVRLSNPYYTIEDVYERGYILYRVRNVRPDSVHFTYEKFSPWSPFNTDEGIVANYTRKIETGAHTGDSINWNYQVSYIEEGKRKDVVGYYDGLLKPRQQVAISNAENLVVVGETKYDFNGRPAVQILPVPALNADEEVENAYDNRMRYYERFNRNTNGDAYSASDFDSLMWVCPVDTAGELSTVSGASQYYSEMNTDKSGHQKYVPDAHQYPMVHTEYMPDNTGRIRRQGGVGKDHQLGSGHETFYHYSQPQQSELDRLFGSEVGDFSRYKKQTVTDGNGQISVSYVDMQGRVIATALAEESPDNLQAIPENRPNSIMFSSLKGANLFQDNGLNIVHEHTLNKEGPLYIDYRMQTSVFKDNCMPVNLCFKCVYNYEISLINKECNEVVFTFQDTIGFLNPGDTLCGVLTSSNLVSKRYELNTVNSLVDTTNADTLIRINGLPKGTYYLHKRLYVNEGAIDMYYDHFAEKASCAKTYDEFYEEALERIDFSVCDPCDTCGDDISYCDALLGIMKADVSPGGQYAPFETETDGDIVAITDPASIFHSDRYKNIKGYRAGGDVAMIMLNDGSIDSVYKADVHTFVGAFREEWADSLVKLHPEYCYYLYCRDSLSSSYAYDFDRWEVSEFDSAVVWGYMNPTGVTGTKYGYPSGGVGADPFFAARPALKAAMNSRLKQIRVFNDTAYNIWDMAGIMVFCNPITDAKENYACRQAFANPRVLDSLFFSRKFRNDYLSAFNSLYNSAKMSIIDSLLALVPGKYNAIGYSFPTCTVGESGCTGYESKIRRYATASMIGIDVTLDDAALGVAIETAVNNEMDNDSTCYFTSLRWMEALAGCPHLTPTLYNDIREGFQYVCEQAKLSQTAPSPFPLAEVPASNVTATFHSAEEVLFTYLGADYRDKLCNVSLLSNAYPAAHNYFAGTQTECKCTEARYIEPPKIIVQPETPDRFTSACIKDTLMLTPFGEGILPFLNELKDSNKLYNSQFHDTAYASYLDYWIGLEEHKMLGKTIVKAEVVARDYKGSMASRGRTEWKFNFMNPTDPTSRCNIFFDLNRADGDSLALRNVQPGGFFNMEPITEDSFIVHFYYRDGAGDIQEGQIKGVSGCGSIYELSCVAYDYDTLYGKPYMVDSSLFDSFAVLARSIRKGMADSLLFDYSGSGDECSVTGYRNAGGVCKLEQSDKAALLVNAITEMLYSGRLDNNPLQSMSTTWDPTYDQYFMGTADLFGLYNFTMEKVSPTYADYFALDWSRYSGYRGSAFRDDDEEPYDCFDDINIYRDPDFIGIGQFGVGMEGGSFIANCHISFGDPYHTGANFNEIDSLINYRFDTILGAWVVDAYEFSNIDGGGPPRIHILRVMTCFDKPICSDFTFASLSDSGNYKRTGFTSGPAPSRYTFSCYELNRYYEEQHDASCSDALFSNNTTLGTFVPFFLQQLFDDLARKDSLVSHDMVLFPGGVTVPTALNTLIASDKYRTDRVGDSLLVGYIGQPNAVGSGCQLSLRLLSGDPSFSFARLDSFGRIRADDEKLIEYMERGEFEKGKHFFVINAYDVDSGYTYKLRGWLSCMPVYECLTLVAPVEETPDYGCGCATCPEFKAQVDSFMTIYPTITYNDEMYPNMFTNFLNTRMNNNLSYAEYERFMQQCLIYNTKELAAKESDYMITGNLGESCMDYIDGVMSRINENFGFTIPYTKMKEEGETMVTVKFDLSDLPNDEYARFLKLISDSVTVAPCSTQISSSYVDYIPASCDIWINFEEDTGATDACHTAFEENFANLLAGRFGISLGAAVAYAGYEPYRNGEEEQTKNITRYCVNLDALTMTVKHEVYAVLDSLLKNCTYARYGSTFITAPVVYPENAGSVSLYRYDTTFTSGTTVENVQCSDIYEQILHFHDSVYRYNPHYVREASSTGGIQNYLYNFHGFKTQIFESQSNEPADRTDLNICTPNSNGIDLVKIFAYAAERDSLFTGSIVVNGNIPGGVFQDPTGETPVDFTGTYHIVNADTVWLTFTINRDTEILTFTVLADSMGIYMDRIFTIEKRPGFDGFILVGGINGSMVRYPGWGTLGELLNCCSYPKPTLCFRPAFDKFEPDTGDCRRMLTDIARSNALSAYNQYGDSLKMAFKQNYVKACIDSAMVKEKIHIGAGFAEYHYTLYYYDQAGNLVKTVPPAGVDTIDLNPGISLMLAQNRYNYSPASHYFTQHKLATTYQYNSLGQVTRQNTPDAGASRFYYDVLGRLVLSQNSKQHARGNIYSYTVRDAMNRVTEVGEIAIGSLNEDSLKYQYNLYYPALLEAGLKTQITRTFYDTSYSNTVRNLFGAAEQQYLRGRVSTVAYFEYDVPQYEYATHYSYDIHGNVDVLIQDYPELTVFGNRYKYIYYHYDLISGKVNMVRYQPGQPDRFYHSYVYDADNRLTEVYTSTDSVIWDNDAGYTYYRHGPLARMTLGEYNVQGVDYAYTIHGWLKGVNSNTLDSTRDMGRDGHHSNALNFASDVFGFTLGYYNGDYKPIDNTYYNTASAFVANISGSPLAANSLYNGNISHMVTAVKPLMVSNKPMATIYSYDQLSRITGMETYTDVNTTTNAWNSGSAGSAYLSTFTYDPNGNIMKLFRNGMSSIMDSLNYSYYPGTNRLRHVTDNVSAGTYPDDIDNQTAGNYGYDAIGNLAKDHAEEIDTIQWNVYGKITKIERDSGSTRAALAFKYDASGQRTMKLVKNGESENEWNRQYYVRDAQGNVMATYSSSSYVNDDEVNTATVTEWITDTYGEDSLVKLMQLNYSEDASFISNYITVLFDNSLADEVYTQITIAEMLHRDESLVSTILTNFRTDDASVYSFVGQIVSNYKTLFITNMNACDRRRSVAAALESDKDYSTTVYLTYLCNTYGLGTLINVRNALGLGSANNCGAVIAAIMGHANYYTVAGAMVTYYSSSQTLAALNSMGNTALINAFNPYNGYFPVNMATCINSNMTSGDRTNLRTFFGTIYTDSTWVRSTLFTYAGESILADMGDHDALDFVKYAILANPEKLNDVLMELADFNIIAYLNLVRERWGTGAYEDLIDEMIFTQEFKAVEQHLYGSSRLGIKYADTTMFRREFTITGFDSLGQFIVDEVLDSVRLHIDDSNYYRTLAMKQFEMTNHLGNVLATVTDRTTPVGTTAITAYKADIISAQYYYPFGSPMTKWESDTSYRYKFGFNGKENDSETYGTGNAYDFGARIYDSRLGRFLTLDPKGSLLPGISAYSFATNSPIFFIDYNGEHPKVAIIVAQKRSDFSEHQAALEKAGYKVVYALTGQEALLAMKNNSTPESPTSNLILISHGSPGGLSCGGGGIWTQSELENYAKSDWKNNESWSIYVQQNGVSTNFEDPNFDWDAYSKAMEGYNDDWINANFEQNKAQISQEYKDKTKIITPEDIANAQSSGGFETENLSIVLGGCNLAGYIPLDDQVVFATELAVTTKSTVWGSQGYTSPDHSKNTPTPNLAVKTTTPNRTSTGSWIKTDSNGARTDTGKKSLNLTSPTQ